MTSSTNTIEQGSRFHYMDNLRALAMLVGVLFHAALAYSPMMQNLWLSADPSNSVIMDVVGWFTHLFRMPLFFVIAGFFALFLVEKRGAKDMLINRTKRILVPFILFLPVTLAATIGGMIWAVGSVENYSPFLHMVAANMNNPDAPQPPFSTMHLWFLYNLCWFCVMMLVLNKAKLFDWAPLQKAISSPWMLLVLPLVLVPSMYSQTAPHPAAEKIYPELWSFGFYGVFFIFGGLLYKQRQVLEQWAKYWPLLLSVSLIAYAYFYMNLPETMSIADIMKFTMMGEKPEGHLVTAIIEAYISLYMSIVCLVLGKKFLDKQNSTMRFVADSSYWVYIVHLPVIWVIQYAMLDVHLNHWLEFLITVAATMAFGMITYIVLVRSTIVGRLLNGKKRSLKTMPEQAVAQ